MDFELLITQEEILSRIRTAAKQINEDYEGKDLMLLMIMKGAILFVADLMRHLEPTCTLEFLYCSSYRDNEQGELRVHGLDELNVSGKDVLIVDDIFDTGKTISEVVRRVQEKQPASLKSAVLLSRNVERTIYYRPDYSLFEIQGDAFVLGYGLDYDERYRGLPGLYCVNN